MPSVIQEQRQSHPHRIYLLAHPRTCSNLLVKILNLDEQPMLQVHHHSGGGYFFIDTTEYMFEHKELRETDSAQWTKSQKAGIKALYQQCADKMTAYVNLAEMNGKTAFVKEHMIMILDPLSKTEPLTINIPTSNSGFYPLERAPGNLTVLPDAYLSTFAPTIVIRHPALVFPSGYRTTRDTYLIYSDVSRDEASQTLVRNHYSFKWQRSIYEWFISHGQTPIVLDADDIIASPSTIMKYCELIGLDPSKLKFEWNPATAEELAKFPEPIPLRYLDTLSASTGVQKNKSSKGLDVDVEAGKWKEEFGQDMGTKIEGFVKNAMADYEFLKERRLRA